MKKTKKFDCVEMMHQGADYVREKLKNMSPEEQSAYWQKRTQELLDRKQKSMQDRVRKAS